MSINCITADASRDWWNEVAIWTGIAPRTASAILGRMAYRSPAPVRARFDERKRVFWARHTRYVRLFRAFLFIPHASALATVTLFSDAPSWPRWYLVMGVLSCLPWIAASVLRPSKCPECDRHIGIDGMHAGTRYGACWFCSYSREEAETDVFRALSRNF